MSGRLLIGRFAAIEAANGLNENCKFATFDKLVATKRGYFSPLYRVFSSLLFQRLGVKISR